MKKILRFLYLFVLILSCQLFAQETGAIDDNVDGRNFEIGNETFTLPALPKMCRLDGRSVKLDAMYRAIAKGVKNRVIALYGTEGDDELLRSGTFPTLDRSVSIQTVIDREKIIVPPKGFVPIKSGLKLLLGKPNPELEKVISEVQSSTSKVLRDLPKVKAAMQIDKTAYLGVFAEDETSLSHTILQFQTWDINGEKTEILQVTSVCIMQLGSKVISAYASAKCEGTADLEWTRQACQDFRNRIRIANPIDVDPQISKKNDLPASPDADSDGEEEKVFESLMIMAVKGYPKAQIKVGERYLSGEGVEASTSEGVNWLTKASDQGDSEAQCKLAMVYSDGSAMVKNFKKAFALFKKSASQGHAEAQFELGGCYHTGMGTEVELQLAVSWYKKAAHQNHGAAQLALADCYRLGKGVQKDSDKAREWEKKARANHVVWEIPKKYNPAILDSPDNGELDEGLDSGITFKKKTRLMLLKAAEEGEATAQWLVAGMYRSGDCVEKDLTKAFEWEKKSAAQGHLLSMNKLGHCYYFGEGTQVDFSKALYWHREAALQGHAGSMYMTGLYYMEGQGVARDMKKAFEWLQKAAEQGHADAQHDLGLCYMEGTGVLKDPKVAAQWFAKVAELGDANVQYNLGLCYYYGDGVLKNPKTAVQWFKKAAEQGDAGAQLSLGICYDFGKGVLKDPKTAVQWYRKAAEQGHALAQFNLGVMYYSGEGVLKDPKMAKMWIKKAHENGDKDAGEFWKKNDLWKY